VTVTQLPGYKVYHLVWPHIIKTQNNAPVTILSDDVMEKMVRTERLEQSLGDAFIIINSTISDFRLTNLIQKLVQNAKSFVPSTRFALYCSVMTLFFKNTVKECLLFLFLTS
jgi:hypothetical protein